MARVHLLDPHTVNQIAAGEVVERPASVLKELVENALDARATRIDVELVDSGRTRIRVTDDGIGMSAEDALSSLQRHATSKITSADDLMAVGTLGFRGEALPSIASVSRMTLTTSESDGLRTVLRVEGGNIQPVAGSAGPRGTEILVEDLFFNTPARLKFLKSDTTELGQCMEHLTRYAVAYPDVRITMTHNGQKAFETTGSGEMQSAIAEVWNRDLARSLAAVDFSASGMRLHGFVSPPHITKPTRAYQYIFVNGRPVRTRTLTAALDQAFRDITPERRFPVVVLMIDIDPEQVDVNVSPTKSEVKFQREGSAFDAIRLAMKSALMEHGMMPNAEAIAAANQALAASRPSGPSAFDFALRAQAPVSFYNPAEQPALDAMAVPLPASAIPIQATTVDRERFPFAELVEGLRVIGQAMTTFIIAETHGGLLVIDQHVAHERILYEYLCGLKGPSAIEKQALLVPQTLHLDRRQALLLRDKLDEIIEVGFDIEPFGGDSYVVRAVPAAIRSRDPIAMLRDMVDELVESSVTRKLVPTREAIWIMSSCKMAVKAGDPLSMADMERLIVDLASTENPYLCPHGRPITITLSAEALLRMFKRT